MYVRVRYTSMHLHNIAEYKCTELFFIRSCLCVTIYKSGGEKV